MRARTSPTVAAANVRAALALMHNAVNGLGAQVRAPQRPRRVSPRRARSRWSAAGPAGLYFAILMRKVRPDCAVTVFERNQPTDAFGFGVVFSDETLSVFEHADPELRGDWQRFARWTDIDIHHRGSVTRSGGHGFSALGRRELLAMLQRRAAASWGGGAVLDRGADAGGA